jgi:hypothetical protein
VVGANDGFGETYGLDGALIVWIVSAIKDVARSSKLIDVAVIFTAVLGTIERILPLWPADSLTVSSTTGIVEVDDDVCTVALDVSADPAEAVAEAALDLLLLSTSRRSSSSLAVFTASMLLSIFLSPADEDGKPGISSNDSIGFANENSSAEGVTAALLNAEILDAIASRVRAISSASSFSRARRISFMSFPTSPALTIEGEEMEDDAAEPFMKVSLRGKDVLEIEAGGVAGWKIGILRGTGAEVVLVGEWGEGG